MRTFRLLLGLLSSIAILAMLWYAFEVFGADPLSDREEYRQYVVQGDKVWEEWCKLEKWQEWSPYHMNTVWRAGTDWKAGGKFEEMMRVGWPYETLKGLERIDLVFVPDRVAYVRERGTPVSYRFWRFEYVPGGGTRVASVEVLHSSEIGFLRPLIEGRWQRNLEASLRGLAQFVERAK